MALMLNAIRLVLFYMNNTQGTQLNFRKDVPKVDEGVCKQMKAHPIHLSALKAHEQALKLVDPGKGSLADKALLVHGLVEMTLPTTLHALPITLIFGDIGHYSSVP